MLQNRPNQLSRRAILSAGATALAGCAHKRAPRYEARLFVASAAEKAIVVSDLASFRRAGSIPLDTAPGQVLDAQGKLYAVCSATQNIVRIDPDQNTVTGKIPVGSKIAGAALTTDGKYLAVATVQPPKVVLIDTKIDKVIHETPLPVAPTAIAAAANQAAVLLNSATLARVNIPDGTLAGISPIGATTDALQYRKDGETIFVAAPDTREIISLSAKTGAVLARLPVPIRPARFCINGDGGQVFITGADNDPQLVIFSPYQNQIYETLYAGHALFGMAVAPIQNLLFLSNPDSGDVSILNIGTLRFEAKMIHTGGNPRQILVAPSTGPEEYAFAVDAETGDVSVIHIPVVLHKRGDPFIAEPPKPVFAVFHGGADPQSAVIVPYTM